MRGSRVLLNEKPFGAFQIKPAIGRLPVIKNIRPEALNLPFHPRYKYPAQTLLRSIDVEQRFRLDYDSRTKLFEDKIKPGSIILIDQITSRKTNQTKSFAGVFLGKTKRGVMSSIVLKSKVMGVGIEMKIPIYSPMVKRFVVLKDSPFDDIKDCYFLREEKSDKIDFDEIENLMIKFKNQESRGLLEGTKQAKVNSKK
jgi:ribosomal protein L19